MAWFLSRCFRTLWIVGQRAMQKEATGLGRRVLHTLCFVSVPNCSFKHCMYSNSSG